MSAKKKQGASSPGKSQRRPSASPADGESPAFTPPKEWKFQRLIAAYQAGKPKNPLETAAGRELTAAAFYEYARECPALQKVCQQWLACDERQVQRFGPDWKQRLAAKQDKESRKKRLPTDSGPFFTEELSEDGQSLNPDSSEMNRLAALIDNFGRHMGCGCLLWCLRDQLAAGTAWQKIDEDRRKGAITEAWNSVLDEPPRWSAEIESEDELRETGRDLSKGEQPFIALSLRAEMPRAVHHIAERDEGRDSAQYHSLASASRTGSEWQQAWDAAQLAWMKNQPDPRQPKAERRKATSSDIREIDPGDGNEHLVFRIPWRLTDDDLKEQFAHWLGIMRPKEWKDHAAYSAKSENAGPVSAMLALAAVRIARLNLGREKTHECYYSAYKKWRPKPAVPIKEMSRERRKAEQRLSDWGIEHT